MPIAPVPPGACTPRPKGVCGLRPTGGASWARILLDGGLRTTAVDPLDGSFVFAGGEAGFWRSTDAGATWQETGPGAMRGGLSGEPTSAWEGVQEITSDPLVPGRLYAVAHGTGKGLYRSDDRGATWQPRLLADDYLRSIAVDPNDANNLTIGSSSAWGSGGYDPGSAGVRRSTDAGQSWTDLNLGLDWPFALDVVHQPGSSCTLFAASPGGGIVRRDLCSTCRVDSLCAATANSTGQVAHLSADVSPSLADQTLVLLADNLPPSQFSIFFYGSAQTSVSLGNGTRCVDAGPTGFIRLGPVRLTGPGGRVGQVLDFGSAPIGMGAGALNAGVTYTFQLFYRDPPAGGADFNLSDALAVQLCP